LLMLKILLLNLEFIYLGQLMMGLYLVQLMKELYLVQLYLEFYYKLRF